MARNLRPASVPVPSPYWDSLRCSRVVAGMELDLAFSRNGKSVVAIFGAVRPSIRLLPTITLAMVELSQPNRFHLWPECGRPHDSFLTDGGLCARPCVRSRPQRARRPVQEKFRRVENSVAPYIDDWFKAKAVK